MILLSLLGNFFALFVPILFISPKFQARPATRASPAGLRCSFQCRLRDLAVPISGCKSWEHA